MVTASTQPYREPERFLRDHLIGRTVRVRFAQKFLKHREPSLDGVRVSGVEACGSQARILFEDGRALMIDLQEVGAWRAFALGEEWDRPHVRARVVLETDTHELAAFSAPVVVFCADSDPVCRLHCYPEPGVATIG